ncbi:hypothetical protein SeLEV6574_g02703 [Synchytrium endobioticum]|nr:hypothetical protein SeLEV6574_g02703 [Synchytrium endobioticum]
MSERLESNDDHEFESRPRKRPKSSTGLIHHDYGPACSDDRYTHGSITRIKLKNFLTYHEAEFYPGPYMNMVIGPNGTGKSSVVAAIIVTLGGKLKLLDRHDRSGDLVRLGETDGLVELELKVRSGRLVISRSFNKSANDSKFKINGKQATLQEVKRRVEELDIQVDNLCQCLPQEMVGEFAELNAQQRLKETQRCAGDGQLTEWHQKLIEDKKKEMELLQDVSREREVLADNRKRNEAIEARVQGYRNREVALRKLRFLELVRSIIIKQQRRNEAQCLQNEEKPLKTGVVTLRNENQPSIIRRDAAKEAKDRVDVERRSLRTQYDNSINGGRLGKAMERLEDLERQIDQKKSERSAMIEAGRRYKSEVDRLEKDMDKCKEQYDRVKVEAEEMGISVDNDHTVQASGGKIAQLSAEQSDITRALADLEAERDSTRGCESEIMQTLNGIQSDLDRLTLEMSGLANAELQKEKKFLENPFTGRNYTNAVRWIKENRQHFVGKVYLPAILEIKVSDANLAKQVEAALPPGLRSTIIASDPSDFALISKHFAQNEWRVNIAEITQPMRSADFRPPRSQEELRELGFLGYVTDFIEGPDDVILFLCAKADIHRKPIARMDADIRKDMETVRSLGFSNWFTSETSFVVRGAYGMTNIISNSVYPAQLLSYDVDNEERSRIQTDINRLKDIMEQERARMRPIQSQRSDIERRRRVLDDRKRVLQQERQVMNDKKRELQMVRNRLESLASQLKRKQEESQARDEKLSKFDEEVSAKRKQRFEYILEVDTLRSLNAVLFHTQVVHAELSVMEANCELEAAREVCQRLEAELKAAEDMLSDVRARRKVGEERFKTARGECDRLKDLFKQKDGGLNQEEIDEMKRLEANSQNYTDLSEVQDLLAQQKATVALNRNDDGAIVQQYEERERLIEEGVGRLADKEAVLAQHKNDMQEIKDQWVPQIKKLVDNISDRFRQLFRRINCAGECRIAEHEDYNLWGIEILVCFRQNEELRELRAERQSGGERAVSTMLYLLALQEFSRAPFRVVDEINQGMDPNNERMIHKLMVEGASRESAGQYFLITPKLLQNLDYHERMKVFCIYSGPAVVPRWNARKFLATALPSKRKRGSTGAESPNSDQENQLLSD